MQSKILSNDYSINKLTFCSSPDIIEHSNSFALINYNNDIIKKLLNILTDDIVFYLCNQESQKEWLNKIQKQVKITIDCNLQSIEQIKDICQKK